MTPHPLSLVNDAEGAGDTNCDPKLPLGRVLLAARRPWRPRRERAKQPEGIYQFMGLDPGARAVAISCQLAIPHLH